MVKTTRNPIYWDIFNEWNKNDIVTWKSSLHLHVPEQKVLQISLAMLALIFRIPQVSDVRQQDHFIFNVGAGFTVKYKRGACTQYQLHCTASAVRRASK